MQKSDVVSVIVNHGTNIDKNALNIINNELDELKINFLTDNGKQLFMYPSSKFDVA